MRTSLGLNVADRQLPMGPLRLRLSLGQRTCSEESPRDKHEPCTCTLLASLARTGG